jgi:hypothetical protein
MLVADIVSTIDSNPTFDLYALLHDASEAVLGDMPRPLKHFSAFGSDFRAIERKVSDVIADAFALPRGYEKLSPIKLADNWATAIEAYYLMPSAPWITGLIDELNIASIVDQYATHFSQHWLDIPETKTAFLERILLAMRRVGYPDLRPIAQIL